MRGVVLAVGWVLGLGACSSAERVAPEPAASAAPSAAVTEATARIVPCVGVAAVMPLDLPKPPASAPPGPFAIEMPENGDVLLEGHVLADDQAIAAAAKRALAADPHVRAVIRADSQARHGRVMHVVDVLKQMGITKIAFGTTPAAPMSTGAGR